MADIISHLAEQYNEEISQNTTFTYDNINGTFFNASDSINWTESSTILHPDTGSSLANFTTWYQGFHGYVSIIVCIFGVIFNLMTIVVLTHKTMITSTNTILTALAIADMLTMASYLPYAFYFYIISKPEAFCKHPKGWIIYLLFNTNLIITVHTIAMWLTVSLAVFRYIVVCHHTLGPKLCNLKRAKITIAAVFISTIIFCIPNYVMYFPEKNPAGGYWFNVNSFVHEFHKVFNFWLYGVVLKVAPCVLLTVLSSLLIRAMREADKKRRRLKHQGKRAESERTSEHNRTTAMLVTVVLCFVVTELPQGIIAFLSGVDTNIFYNIYVPLGDIFDVTVLINSSVNFILYCIMSRQFRKTFKEVFLSWCTVKMAKMANGVHYSTINSQTTQSTRL